MPRSWIPFRGNDYSKENSKRYIPKRASESTRIFGTIVLISIAVIFTLTIVTNAFSNENSVSYIALAVIIYILLISIVAFRDARKIDAKNKQKSNLTKSRDD